MSKVEVNGEGGEENTYSRVTIGKPEVFLDLRDKGFRDIIIGTLFEEENGSLSFRFPHSVISDYLEDDFVGIHDYITLSWDNGRTWGDPALSTMPRVKDMNKESFNFGPVFRTREGTILYYGIHQVLDTEEGTAHKNMDLRDYMNLYARQEKGETNLRIQEWPPGTFMGEQFVQSGLQLPSGRLLFTIWGIDKRGENWRCGVLLSDDDGRTWRLRTVGYEPDLSIRDKSTMPAGFNEQTVFYTREGKIVSIIRGRDKLGRGVPGGGNKDTWFFHSESEDEGESWSKPIPTNLPGTGATGGQGLTLPDGSLLIGCRVPFSRDYYPLTDSKLYGLNFARSHDNGRTWSSEKIIQHDPDGNGMNSHHCAMNGIFRKLSDTEFEYIFGFFGYAYDPKLQRMLKLKLTIQ